MPTPLFRSSRNAAAPVERRKSHRYDCNLGASWRLLGAPDLRFIPAKVQNISRSGLGLQVTTDCKKGVLLTVQFEGVPENLVGPWLAQVVNVRQKTGQWLLGCSLFSEFTEEQMQALLGGQFKPEPSEDPLPKATANEKAVIPSPAQKNGSERRTSPRRAGKRVAIIITASSSTGKRYFGRVRDVSAGGLALVSPRALAAGSVIQVRPTNAGLAIPWTTVRVKHCRGSNQQWIVGCQFTESVSAGVLELFG